MLTRALVLLCLSLAASGCFNGRSDKARNEFISAYIVSVCEGTEFYTRFLPSKDPEYFRQEILANRHYLTEEFELGTCDESKYYAECHVTFSNGTNAVVALSRSLSGEIDEASIAVRSVGGPPERDQ